MCLEPGRMSANHDAFVVFIKQQNNSLPEQLPVVDLHIYILLFPKIEESTFIPSAIKLIRIRRG